MGGGWEQDYMSQCDQNHDGINFYVRLPHIGKNLATLGEVSHIINIPYLRYDVCTCRSEKSWRIC